MSILTLLPGDAIPNKNSKTSRVVKSIFIISCTTKVIKLLIQNESIYQFLWISFILYSSFDIKIVRLKMYWNIYAKKKISQFWDFS